MASIPSFFSSSFLKRIVTPNSVVVTSKPPPLFPNRPTKPLPSPVALSPATRNPQPDIPSVPRIEPPSFPKEMPIGPSRDPAETDPGVPPEIIVDPPPTDPVPDPNPTPKPEGPKPPLSPPGLDIPMPPRRPDDAPPRPPGPEIIPPPSTPPDISPPPTPEGPQIIV